MGRRVDVIEPGMTGDKSLPVDPYPAAELDEIEALLRPLSDPVDLDPLLERIGDAGGKRDRRRS